MTYEHAGEAEGPGETTMGGGDLKDWCWGKMRKAKNLAKAERGAGGYRRKWRRRWKRGRR